MTDNGSPLPPPSPGPTPAGAADKPWWKNWWAIAIPVVALLVVIAVVVGTGDDSEEGGADSTGVVASTDTPSTAEISPTTRAPTTSEAPSTTDSPTTTETPTNEAPTTTEAPPTTEATPTTEPSSTTLPPDDSEPTCSYLGTDDFDDMQVELSLTNPLGRVPSLDVTFALKGGDDVRFLTDDEFVQYPLPQERFLLEADTFTELPPGIDEGAITCEILAIEEGFGDVPEPPGPTDACEFVEIDSFGDIQIQLGFTSPFTTTEDIYVYYALRGPAGVRFADSLASVDLVGPGETVRVNEDTVTEPPSWVGDDVTCDILGFDVS